MRLWRLFFHMASELGLTQSLLIQAHAQQAGFFLPSPNASIFSQVLPTLKTGTGFGNHTQSSNAGVMSTIVGDQGYVEKKSSRSDPCVCRRNRSPTLASAVHCLGPPTAHLIVRVKD